jgi:hypothetical protein
MNAKLWTTALLLTKAQVEDELRSKGYKVPTFSHAELKALAKERLVEECREWISRNA